MKKELSSFFIKLDPSRKTLNTRHYVYLVRWFTWVGTDPTHEPVFGWKVTWVGLDLGGNIPSRFELEPSLQMERTDRCMGGRSRAAQGRGGGRGKTVGWWVTVNVGEGVDGGWWSTQRRGRGDTWVELELLPGEMVRMMIRCTWGEWKRKRGGALEWKKRCTNVAKCV